MRVDKRGSGTVVITLKKLIAKTPKNEGSWWVAEMLCQCRMSCGQNQTNHPHLVFSVGTTADFNITYFSFEDPRLVGCYVLLNCKLC